MLGCRFSTEHHPSLQRTPCSLFKNKQRKEESEEDKTFVSTSPVLNVTTSDAASPAIADVPRTLFFFVLYPTKHQHSKSFQRSCPKFPFLPMKLVLDCSYSDMFHPLTCSLPSRSTDLQANDVSRKENPCPTADKIGPKRFLSRTFVIPIIRGILNTNHLTRRNAFTSLRRASSSSIDAIDALPLFPSRTHAGICRVEL
jgi:hypothetical protein